MEWAIRLEVKTGRGEVERIDLGTITRSVVATAAAAEGECQKPGAGWCLATGAGVTAPSTWEGLAGGATAGRWPE